MPVGIICTEIMKDMKIFKRIFVNFISFRKISLFFPRIILDQVEIFYKFVVPEGFTVTPGWQTIRKRLVVGECVGLD